MAYRVVLTKEFTKRLNEIQKARRDIYRKASTAAAEASRKGDIQDLNYTFHGESRLSDIQKYNLGDGYRLVVQVIDRAKKSKAFLFIGNHDDTERWLDNHRAYTWVKKESDGTLDFVLVSEDGSGDTSVIEIGNSDSLETTKQLPLLRTVTKDEWDSLPLSEEVLKYVSKVTLLDFQRDFQGILEHIETISDSHTAYLFHDLFQHANLQEYEKLAARIALAAGQSSQPVGSELELALGSMENSENTISFDDELPVAELLSKGNLSDWLLFLHPAQRKLAFGEFRGPVRVRGVSGSGKTSVLVHRARFLAYKTKRPILVVTLTESMRKLLAILLDDLCGAERKLIETYTMSSLVSKILRAANPAYLYRQRSARQVEIEQILRIATDECQGLPDFESSVFRDWSYNRFRSFIKDEIELIRDRLLPSQFDIYLDSTKFKRVGRGIALAESSRRICIVAANVWNRELGKQGLYDNVGKTSLAASILNKGDQSYLPRYEALVADEVQDLSQVEMTILSNVTNASGNKLSSAENGLFLAGDGAQSIYGRGFTFRAVGIEIANRSYLLKKNYRNTFEILQAAYSLICPYSFADNDEDEFAPPSTPDFANRRGERPRLVKCETNREQTLLASDLVRKHLAKGIQPGQVCVIGTNLEIRTAIRVELNKCGIPSVELRDDADYLSKHVKVSTIESSKGHEFAVVVIVGLNDGILPRMGLQDDELSREASRLYVAMTRARENLWMSYSLEGDGPSRFLPNIQSWCDELKYVGGKLSALEPLAE